VLAALPAQAQWRRLTITEVFVDFDHEQIIITGEYLDRGRIPTVLLGKRSTPLTLISYSDSEIVVDLPPGLPDGDYRLTVSTGRAFRNKDTYDLTIGAGGLPGIGIGVSDGAGADLGLLIEWGVPPTGFVLTYLPAINALIHFSHRDLRIVTRIGVYFTRPGCQGDPFVSGDTANFLLPAGAPDRFFLGRPAIPATTAYRSRLIDTGCIEEAGQAELIPAEEISEPLGFTSQLVAPLSLRQLTRK
jgi:hypothetical protein